MLLRMGPPEEARTLHDLTGLHERSAHDRNAHKPADLSLSFTYCAIPLAWNSLLSDLAVSHIDGHFIDSLAGYADHRVYFAMYSFLSFPLSRSRNAFRRLENLRQPRSTSSMMVNLSGRKHC